MNILRISLLSRVLLVVICILFFVALQFPMWRIELEAPQYPEGLVLQLHANKIAGDVAIINGLNHYIGMKTLNTDDFFEFKVLSYIIGFFGVFSFIVALIARRKWVIALFISLVTFVSLAAVDFYRWNYEYGHNLNPDAAIKVPGMSYQPPLIGYKQLLNFGAYSIPDTGGWILISAGLLLFMVLVIELKLLKTLRNKMSKNTAASVMLLLVLTACSSYEPEPLKIHKDRCSHCKMTISDSRFGAEVITEKGRVYKFDDLFCLLNYIKEENSVPFARYFINDYQKSNVLIDAEKAFYIESQSLKSPMGGNTAAFRLKTNAETFAKKENARVLTWNELRQQ